MAVEVEARFTAQGRAPLDRLAAAEALGPALLGPPVTVVEEDRYLDTPDGRLASARWACRLRTRGGETRVSLKGPPDHPTSGWLHRRPEVEGPATPSLDPAAWPRSDARDLLLQLAGASPLSERLRLVQQRTERGVAIDGRTVGGLTLDAVTVQRGGAPRRTIHLVELELGPLGDAAHDLDRLAEALLAEPGLVPEPRTKLELALDLD